MKPRVDEVFAESAHLLVTVLGAVQLGTGSSDLRVENVGSIVDCSAVPVSSKKQVTAEDSARLPGGCCRGL